MLVPSIIDAKYNPAKMQNPLAIPRFVESSTPKITHSILRRPNIFLNHAQMDSESLQIDFEWACNLEQPYGRFYFGDSCLILDESASVCALSQFAFNVSQSAVQSVDTTNVQPSEEARREANDGNQHRGHRNDKKHDSVEE